MGWEHVRPDGGTRCFSWCSVQIQLDLFPLQGYLWNLSLLRYNRFYQTDEQRWWKCMHILITSKWRDQKNGSRHATVCLAYFPRMSSVYWEDWCKIWCWETTVAWSRNISKKESSKSVEWVWSHVQLGNPTNREKTRRYRVDTLYHKNGNDANGEFSSASVILMW